MAQPVITIRDCKAKETVVANVLPCKLHHDGHIGEIQSHWTVKEGKDGRQTAYFRGRELHGSQMELPADHRGVVLQSQSVPSDSTTNQSKDSEAGSGDTTENITLKSATELERVVIWGHESTAEALTDPHARAMEEWIEASGKIHSFSAEGA